jgi:hypothetical protein
MTLAMIALASIVSLAPAQTDPATIGVMLDAGVPDGACLSLVARPWSFLRIHAGGGYNLVGPGARGGLTLIPFDTFIRPTLSIEAGRYFDGDLRAVNALVPIGDLRALRIGYDWASAHAGLELDWGGGAFFLQGGMTRILARVEMPEVVSGVEARVFAPMAKLGFIAWID